MVIPITGESDWMIKLGALPSWQPPRCHTVVIAPHPDDETLGAGGMIARLRSLDIEITVVAVTDGENAYPDALGLGKVRELEQTAALARLGVDSDHIHRLRLVDSSVPGCEQRLIDALLTLVFPDVHLVAPWRNDYHPDHEACGRAAEAAAKLTKAQLTSYFFWTWHRATPEVLAGLRLVSLALNEDECRAKRDALACHQSQLKHAKGLPILPDNLLGPAMRTFEVFAQS